MKRLVLAGAFLLWAVVQFLSPGRLSVFLGDVVVAAYVLDLFWLVQDQQRNEGPSAYRKAATPFPKDLMQNVDA